MDLRQIKAIEKKYKEQILKICPDVKDHSGIYFFIREENGFKYAYVGQAVHVLTRLAEHLQGHDQHIDLSIKNHKLWSQDNPTGWKIHWLPFEKDKLNEKEQHFIRLYANAGYQMRNKTSGSQGKGKSGIADNKPSKGYHDGLHKGYENARKFIANLFNKNLKCAYQGNKAPTKNQEKAMMKFNEFIGKEEDC